MKNEVPKIIEVGRGFGSFGHARSKRGSGARSRGRQDQHHHGWRSTLGSVLRGDEEGGEDAAKDLGADFQWVTSTDTANFDTDYAKLVKQSASRHPSALIIGNYFPHALDPIIKDITAAGEPVFIFHDGGASWKEDGAIGYIGFDSYALGKRVAGLTMKAGAKKGICVNHVPGNVDSRE